MIIFGRWPPSRLAVGVALIMTGITTATLGGPYWVGIALICAGILVAWPRLVGMFRKDS